MRQFNYRERLEIQAWAREVAMTNDEQLLIDYFNNAYTTKFENGKTIANTIIDKHLPKCTDDLRDSIHNILIDFSFNWDKSMEDTKEKEKILRDFGKKLVESQIDIPAEFKEIVDEKFWDLIGGDEN